MVALGFTSRDISRFGVIHVRQSLVGHKSCPAMAGTNQPQDERLEVVCGGGFTCPEATFREGPVGLGPGCRPSAAPSPRLESTG